MARTLLTVIIASSLAACGGGDSSSEGSPWPTSISGIEQAASVASASLQAVGLASTVVLPMGNVPASIRRTSAAKAGNAGNLATAQQTVFEMVARQKSSALARTATVVTEGPITENCLTSGSVTLTRTYDDVANVTTMLQTFDMCLEDSVMRDGSVFISAALSETDTGFSASETLIFGDGDGDFDDGDVFTTVSYDALGNVLSSMRMDLNMTLSSSINYDADPDQEYGENFRSVTGAASLEEPGQSYLLAYHDFTNRGRFHYASSMLSENDVVNGEIRAAQTEGGVTQKFTITYFQLLMDYQDDFAYESTATNGKLALNFNPDAACVNGGSASGVFVVSTSKPVIYDYGLGHTTAGTMGINNNVALNFEENGSVTVTTDGASTNYADMTELENLCPLDL